ncbi:MAG TPA: glycosyltransferase family 2 protein [Terriglobales bacterium]|nr:glycosyltransferase family 2 protein [Terriglobales bacterium]
MLERRLFPSLSVIIPTYNRQQLLAHALEGYLAQSSPHLICEILVIDDGSTDDTESVVRDCGKRSVFPIRYKRQRNKGPAAARNLGIQQARSELVLFTDSDVIPESDLVEQHIAWHRENPQIQAAVQGYLEWSPAVGATPFMRWYGEHSLFSFGKTRNKREVDFRSFYTCNVSLKTEFLRCCGQFDEEFKSAAYEDSELGYRLSLQGMRLLYNSEAIGYHHQFFSFEDACRKARANAGATQLFFRKEAGRAVLKEIQRKESNFRYKIVTRLAMWAAAALSPFRLLLDSSIPLPGILYRLFFWASVRADKKQTVLAASSNGIQLETLNRESSTVAAVNHGSTVDNTTPVTASCETICDQSRSPRTNAPVGSL